MGIFKKTDERLQGEAIEDLRQKISSARLPSQVQQVASRELELLSKISPSTAEYSIGLTYIDYLISLPWNKKTEDNLNIDRAAGILNERHYGLHKIKERILEHLAVKVLMMSKKPRILVVDDEEIAIKNLEHVLEKENYTVVTASSGMEAIKKIEKFDFDVVLTDLKMEKISGVDVLEKAKGKYSDTQVIMITGYASIDSAIESMKKGAFHYIAKPFKLDEVRATVKQAIEKRLSTRTTKGSILCFAGPPGTGKTSLGRSIADALGRKFARISLGGMKDEAEIRGHRRTYAGAMPGRIIEEIYRTGFANPVLMLDEVDKIGQDFKGDSASALLEVLDPEQNRSFIDHYLDVPFDLSSVMFIVTANVADNIQEPLRDRMEVIEFTGYTEDEKINIALQHLIPKQVHEKGLSEYPPEFTREAITKIVQEHTREAGIRELERQIAAVCRKIAAEFVYHDKSIKSPLSPLLQRGGLSLSPPFSKGGEGGFKITSELVEKYLGPRKYYHEVAGDKNRVGITTGLVWTEEGGDIIFVEAARMKGSGELILTGSLGNVMRESAQAALSYIRSNASAFNISEDFYNLHDIHIHVPAGAIPKDGPSAGCAIAVALISLLTKMPARRDAAVSGELTLSGVILPVGGIKEKLLAARRAGVKAVVLPLKNKVDVESLADDVRQGLDIYLVDKVGEIVDKVLIRY